MIRGYKWTRPDGTSWHDPSVGYTTGATLRVIGAPNDGASCGVGLHFSVAAKDAIGYGGFPGALWRVESDGPILGQDATKYRVASLRVVSSARKPQWVRDVERVISEIGDVLWFAPQGPPDQAWKHYERRTAARAAARAAAGAVAGAAAWAAARDAAWDAAGAAAGAVARAAAWDAALRSRLACVSDLSYSNKPKHTAHVEARWEVWRRGYGLVADVHGVLYTYTRP
jgi:hypothetical protein